ncbi:MAG TPA: glycosyltransferase family 39 protein, partial [Roseimicrobium sp.]|nr:glycosyltransferase family 39 protein [Roseimicrobium sp.]
MNSTSIPNPSETGERWQWKRWHLGVLFVGLIFRFVSAWWISTGDPFGGWDGREYHAFAQSLAVFGGDEYPRFFNFVRAPGYPVLLVPFVWIGGTAIWPVQLVQCFLGVFQAWLLAEIVRRWAGRRAGDWMLLIAAWHPFLVYYNGFVLTETVFTTLLWVAVLLLQQLVIGGRRDVWRSVVWSGLALGMASLVRPATQPLLPIAVIWLGIQAWRTGGFQACWRQMGVFTAMASAILLPWQVGN